MPTATIEFPIRPPAPSRPPRPATVLSPPRVACTDLSVSRFARDFSLARRPVILEGATDDWPARNWTPESLRRRMGRNPVTVRTSQGEQQVPFDALTDAILESTVDRPAPYARNINVERDLPALWPDIQPRIRYACPDWKSSRLLPHDFVFPNGLEELFFGGQGASFPRLHVDYWGMDGFVSQLYGTKEFVLISPDQTEFVYPGDDGGLTSRIDNLADPDLDRFPLFARADVMRFTLHPGDTLYMPNGWWHTTYMPEVSITVITATWHRANWSQFVRQYRVRGQTRGWCKAAVLAYLSAVGQWLALCETVGL